MRVAPLARQVPRTIASLMRAARTFASHVVHADDVDAGGDAQGGRRERRLEPLVGRQVEDLARASTCATSRAGPAGRAPAARRGPRSSSRLWSAVFPKPMPGSTMIDPRGDPGADRPLDGGAQVGDDLGHDVVVARLGAVVHHDQRDAARRGEPGQGVVGADAPDVVEQVRAGVEGRLGDGGLGRVDAERRPGRAARTAARPARPAPAPRPRSPSRGRAASTRRRCRAGRRPRRPCGAPGRPRRRPGRRPRAARRPRTNRG